MSPEEQKARIAIVGFGYIAEEHAKAFAGTERAEIVAASARSEKNRARAGAHAAKVYSDYREMLAQEKPDGVVVCVSADAVDRVTEELLPFGVPLLIEKPPAPHAAGTKALRSKAQQADVPIMVALNRRFYSVIDEALVAIRHAGPLLSVRVEAPERMWQIRASGEHPVHVLDRWGYANSLHCVDLLCMLVGHPLSPSVHRLPGAGAHETNVMAQGKSDRGVLWQYTSCWSSPGRWVVELYGQGVRATLMPLEEGLLKFANGTERALAVLERDRRFKAGFFGQADAFLDLIETAQFDERAASLEKAEASMELVRTLFGYPE